MDYSYSDVDNARRFVQSLNGEVIYSPNLGWLVWDGKRWVENDDRSLYAHVEELIRQVEGSKPSATEFESYKRLLKRMKSYTAIDHMLKLAQRMPETLAEEMDAEPMLLNVGNGMVDLETGRLYPHDKDRHITQITDIPYDPQAGAPRWERFLSEIMCGKTDLVDYLQRAVGYSATGSAKEQCLFILYGRGRNGKTVFIETIRKAFGTYTKNTSPSTFTTVRASAIRNDLARLKDARFLTAVEFAPEGPFQLDGALIKNTTGYDTTNARYLYKEEFEFVPTFKCWIATNHLPEVPTYDEAIWRRIIIVPFDARFVGENDDKELRNKLAGELPGILTWIVRGAVKWNTEGLGAAEIIRLAIDDYRDESNPVAPFIRRRCYFHSQAFVAVGDLYGDYLCWCNANQEKPKTKIEFGRIIRNYRGVRAYRGADKRYWGGIGLNKVASFTELVDWEDDNDESKG